jgi:hypothetical protein
MIKIKFNYLKLSEYIIFFYIDFYHIEHLN